MTRTAPVHAEAPPRSPRGSLRFRLTLLVLVTMFAGLAVGLVLDYRRELAAQTEALLVSLDDQAHTVSLARDGLSDPRKFSSFVDRFCAVVNHEFSPGHTVLVVNAAGELVKHTHVLHDEDTPRVLLTAGETRGVVRVGTRDVAQVRCTSGDGSTIIVGENLDRIDNVLDAQLLSRAITGTVVTLALALLLFLMVNRWVLRPIAGLLAAARRWGARQFAARAPLAGPPDLQLLETALNTMAAELETVESERAAALERARQIQTNLLPRRLPNIPGLAVAAAYRPAESVAGDLYDVFALGDGRTVIAIVDVSGHGISAAMLTGVVKMSLHRRLAETRDPAGAVRRVNRDLLDIATEGEFVTACVGVWDPRERTWTYCSAGHEGGLLLSDGRVRPLDSTGPLLGVLADGVWTNVVLCLNDADRLVLYTDGVTEAGDPSHSLGTSGLTELLLQTRRMDLAEQLSHVADLSAHLCNKTKCDDITIVGLEVLPSIEADDYYVI